MHTVETLRVTPESGVLWRSPLLETAARPTQASHSVVTLHSTCAAVMKVIVLVAKVTEHAKCVEKCKALP